MSCQDKPIPRCFVKKSVDHSVMGNFMKKKYPALSQHIAKPETMSIYCTTPHFEELLTKIAEPDNGKQVIRMKAYFATYCNLSGDLAGISQSYRDTTTLVFVPVNEDETDVDRYFIIHPSDSKIIKINKTLANEMVTFFQDNKAPLLREVAFACKNSFRETSAVWYELDLLNNVEDGWLHELKAQEATGVAIHYGAHDIDDKYRVHDVEIDIGLQLTLILLPVQKVTYKGQDYFYYFDIEDKPDFHTRCKLGNPPATGGNTANPCPPATGCKPSVGDPNP